MTGTRCFHRDEIVSIDLWHTGEHALLKLHDECTVILDEGETEVVRRWSDLAMQTAAMDQQTFLVQSRCDLREAQLKGEKLNRSAVRRSSRSRSKAPAAVVEIDGWKTAQAAQ